MPHSGGSEAGFVVDGADVADVRVPAARVVPSLDPFEDGQGELATGLPAVLVKQLALQGREEAFGHGVDAPIGRC